MVDQSFNIPTFALFGEEQGFPDVLHVETIHERASPLDWRINIHRHAHLVQFLFLEKGAGVLSVEGRAQHIGENSLVFVPQNVPHGFEFEPHTQGRVLSLPTAVVEQTFFERERLFILLENSWIAQADDALRGIFDAVSEEFVTNSEYRRAALIVQVSRLLLWVLRSGVTQQPIQSKARQDILFARFKQALDENFKSHLSAQQYAKDLGVSASHLNRVCKLVSGQPVSRLIRERILHEARRMLAYTSLTIAAIGYELGFQDPAYFGRVFREGTGQSPGAFRRSVSGEQR